MGVIAAMLVYRFVIVQFIDTPRGLGFRMVAALLLAFNVLWWSIADRRFARHILSERRSRLLRLAVLVFSAALNVPIVCIFVTAALPTFLHVGPTWYAAAVTFWHIGLALVLPLVALVRLLGLSAIYAVRQWRHSASGGPKPAFVENSLQDPSRRALLRTAVATVPIAILGGVTIAARAQERRLQVNRHSLPAPWLPDRLRGLTITHISDLHVGRLYRPAMLPRLVDQANALDSDIILVTGDIVDNSNEMLPPGIEALKQLTHRHGIFLCIGNHDEIDHRPTFIREVRRHLPLLVNQRRSLAIGGERLTIAGLDYASAGEAVGRRSGYCENLASTLAGHNPRLEGPVIALAHHPHTWDGLAEAGAHVPLMLSGHTHGGQIMFTPPDERPDMGIGRLLFRYTRGFYRTGLGTLFVNSGVGNWFPLRIHAPAEIVQIQLV